MIKLYLGLMSIPGSEYRVWDVVIGDYPKPSLVEKLLAPETGANQTNGCSTDSLAPTTGEREAMEEMICGWEDADSIAFLTMHKNCEAGVQARIGSATTSKEAYERLRKAYEIRTATEFYMLLNSLFITFDDRRHSIEEHITQYEQRWHTCRGVMSRADLTNDDGFGQGLKAISMSDQAKTEFLLKSLPPFYYNTVENIRAKDYGYYDVVRKLMEYVPQRQKGRNRAEGQKKSSCAENGGARGGN